jgi:chemotaxis protein methyltransferase CheR
MPTSTLTPQLFAILGALVEERAGLHYGASAMELFADKVAQRASDAGFESLLDYYYYLRYDPAGGEELDRLVDALLVHETYFFREADQLRALVDEILLPAASRGARPRVWCAAAATGEEPLTLAMMLAERGALGRVEIVASDLSRRALERARAGVFGARSQRALPPEAARWLTRSGDAAVVDPSLRDAIEWRCANLVDPATYAAFGAFDAIACRNVLIYFSDATAHRVVTSLAEHLVPGGHLLVGASESLLRFGTLLRCEERGGAFFYVKVGA